MTATSATARWRVERVLDLARGDEHAAGVDDVLDAVDDDACSPRRRCATRSPEWNQPPRTPPRSPPACPSSRCRAAASGRRPRRARPAPRPCRSSSTTRVSTNSTERPTESGRCVVLLGPQHGGQRPDLGLAEAVVEADAPAGAPQPLEHGHGHDRRAVVGLAQACAGRASARPGWLASADPHGGREEQRRDAVARDRLEDRVRVGRLEQVVRRPHRQARAAGTRASAPSGRAAARAAGRRRRRRSSAAMHDTYSCTSARWRHHRALGLRRSCPRCRAAATRSSSRTPSSACSGAVVVERPGRARRRRRRRRDAARRGGRVRTASTCSRQRRVDRTRPRPGLASAGRRARRRRALKLTGTWTSPARAQPRKSSR